MLVFLDIDSFYCWFSSCKAFYRNPLTGSNMKKKFRHQNIWLKLNRLHRCDILFQKLGSVAFILGIICLNFSSKCNSNLKIPRELSIFFISSQEVRNWPVTIGYIACIAYAITKNYTRNIWHQKCETHLNVFNFFVLNWNENKNEQTNSPWTDESLYEKKIIFWTSILLI